MKALAIAGMLVAFGAQAEDAPAPCAAVGLAPDAVARLARGSQCRLDPTAVTCRPGLTLAADQHGPRDLCLARDGRPVDRPHCLAARARLEAKHSATLWSHAHARLCKRRFEISEHIVATKEPHLLAGLGPCQRLRRFLRPRDIRFAAL